MRAKITDRRLYPAYRVLTRASSVAGAVACAQRTRVGGTDRRWL